MSIEKLNEIGELSSFKPVKKIIELEKGTPYKILNISILRTKFGKSVLCELEENNVWLPKRYLSFFEKVNLNEYSEGKHYIIYKDLKNFGPNITPIIKFEKKE